MTVGQLFVLFGVKVDKKAFGEASKAVKMLKSAIAVGGLVQMGRSLFHMAEEASEAGTHMHSLSQSMGMSMNMAQKWSYVAEQSGSNLKELSIGVSMLAGNLRKLAIGTASKSLRKTFSDLGITKADAILAHKTTDGINVAMMKAAAMLEKEGVNAKTAALARHAFGARAGRALAADLIRGPEKIKWMFEQLEKLGGVVSDDSILKLQKLFDSINDIKKGWYGVTSEILGQLAPAFGKLMLDLSMWFTRNREVVGVLLIGAFQALATVIRGIMLIVDSLSFVFKKAMDGNLGAIALTGALATGLAVVAKLILWSVIPSLYAMAAAAWAAMAPFWPFILIGAALAVVIALIVQYWDEIVEAADRFWEWLNDNPIAALVLAILNPLIAVYYAIGALIKHWDKFTSAASSAFNKIKSAITTFLGWIKSAFVWLFGGAMWTAMWDGLESASKRAWAAVVEHAKEAWKSIQQLPVIKQLIDFGSFVKRKLTDDRAVSGVMNTLNPQPTTNVTNVPPGYPAAEGSNGANRNVSVSVGGTTINVTGVKDAVAAKDGIADSIDGMHRHAAAALAGEVQ